MMKSVNNTKYMPSIQLSEFTGEFEMSDDAGLARHRQENAEIRSKSTSSFHVLIYSRVSSPHQVQHGQSIEAQPEALKAFSRAQGWTVVDEISDPGRTGRTGDREGFRALMS